MHVHTCSHMLRLALGIFLNYMEAASFTELWACWFLSPSPFPKCWGYGHCSTFSAFMQTLGAQTWHSHLLNPCFVQWGSLSPFNDSSFLRKQQSFHKLRFIVAGLSVAIVNSSGCTSFPVLEVGHLRPKESREFSRPPVLHLTPLLCWGICYMFQVREDQETNGDLF